MSKSDAFEASILDLIFLRTAIADLAEDDSTSPATTLTISLHTADPGEAGAMTANEATYGDYARQTVARSGAGWTRTGNAIKPAADIVFPEAVSGSETLTHFGVGTGVANNLMYSGPITPNIVVTTGVQPILDTDTAITED